MCTFGWLSSTSLHRSPAAGCLVSETFLIHVVASVLTRTLFNLKTTQLLMALSFEPTLAYNTGSLPRKCQFPKRNGLWLTKSYLATKTRIDRTDEERTKLNQWWSKLPEALSVDKKRCEKSGKCQIVCTQQWMDSSTILKVHCYRIQLELPRSEVCLRNGKIPSIRLF